MKVFLAFSLLFIVSGIGLFIQDESLIFKTVLFLVVSIPILWIALLRYLIAQDNRIKELETKVYDLENKRH